MTRARWKRAAQASTVLETLFSETVPAAHTQMRHLPLLAFPAALVLWGLAQRRRALPLKTHSAQIVERTSIPPVASVRRVHSTLVQTRPSRPAFRVPNVELEKVSFPRVEMALTRVARSVSRASTALGEIVHAKNVHRTGCQPLKNLLVFHVNRVLLARVLTQLAQMVRTPRV